MSGKHMKVPSFYFVPRDYSGVECIMRVRTTSRNVSSQNDQAPVCLMIDDRQYEIIQGSFPLYG